MSFWFAPVWPVLEVTNEGFCRHPHQNLRDTACQHSHCQLLVSGPVPPGLIHLLGAASLTTFAKAAAGILLLVVGKVLRRVTARAACIQSWSSFAVDLAPHQFDVGLPGRCATILKCIEARVHEDPDLVMVALNVQDSDSHVSRCTCLRSIFALRPEFAAFVI